MPKSRKPVVVLVPYSGRPLPEYRTAVKRKRNAVWDNAERNTFVSNTAAKLLAGVKAALREFGADSARLPKLGKRPRVTVLVENAEHARRLANHLPGWTAWGAVPLGDVEDGYEPEPRPDTPGTIITLMWAFRYGVECDVLVRAGAGFGEIDWTAMSKHGVPPRLVVDVADISGRKEQEDARARMRDYEKQQLRVVRLGAITRTT